MKLAVGFLTYNELSAKYLADFLPSLETALGFLTTDDYQVYAFDNSPAAEDANRRALELWNTGKIKDIRPRRPFVYLTEGVNLGFSRAYNILVNLAVQEEAEYFFVINPDTLLDPAALQELVGSLDNEAALGSAAPKILRWDFVNHLKTKTLDSLGLVLRPGLQFSDFGQGQEDNGGPYSSDIIGPSGAAGLFRLSALIKIREKSGDAAAAQYFDERFFMYKEDCDLAYRLFLAGYESHLVPSAIVYHDRTAASSGRGWRQMLFDRHRKSLQVRAWSFRNQHFIFIKYWKQQNIASKLIIILKALSMLIFSLILEQFNLKEYYYIKRFSRGLTNTK